MLKLADVICVVERNIYLCKQKASERILMFACSDKRKQEIEFNMLDYCFRCMLNSKYKKI